MKMTDMMSKNNEYFLLIHFSRKMAESKLKRNLKYEVSHLRYTFQG